MVMEMVKSLKTCFIKCCYLTANVLDYQSKLAKSNRFGTQWNMVQICINRKHGGQGYSHCTFCGFQDKTLCGVPLLCEASHLTLTRNCGTSSIFPLVLIAGMLINVHSSTSMNIKIELFHFRVTVSANMTASQKIGGVQKMYLMNQNNLKNGET